MVKTSLLKFLGELNSVAICLSSNHRKLEYYIPGGKGANPIQYRKWQYLTEPEITIPIYAFHLLSPFVKNV